MKKFLLILISSLVLSSCSTNSKSTKAFEPVPCSTIAKQPASDVPILNIKLPCADGKSLVALNEVRGPAIINVWASWCDPCKNELPFFKSISKLYGGKLQLLGIDVEENNPHDGLKFVAENKLNWPQLSDKKGSTRVLFGMGIPVTLFISEDGQIIYKKIGPFKSLQQIQRLIELFFHL